MPKMKTHSGAKKRFKVSSTGKVRAKHATMRHNLSKRSSSVKRSKRSLTVLGESDSKKVRQLLLHP